VADLNAYSEESRKQVLNTEGEKRDAEQKLKHRENELQQVKDKLESRLRT